MYKPGVGGVSDPELIPSSRVAPRYPLRARWRKLEGKVILSAVVEADGRVSSVKVVTAPEPDRGLARSAIQAVRKWRYRPALLEGRPVACHITVVVNFNIE
ncbi:MAG TPA: energy transducer TonB [Acidobacteria bacterium]|nr:energy transducer TonB [Acidobacteriota bacterium]